MVIGEILVEIMADTTGDGFREAQPLTGPFPSGAPAIFADQVAEVSQPVAIISAVGDDDFGHLNLNRLRQDGVDASDVHIDPDRPTGSAFVRYRENGGTYFVFNARLSADRRLSHHHGADDNVIAEADHLHVMGSSLSSPEFAESIAEKVGPEREKINLDGDHLGPNPWRDLPADEAMTKAEAMIAAYARAGFTKLQLDTSMGCKGERATLADEEPP